MNIRTALIGGGLTAAALVGGAVGATLVDGTAGAATTSTTAPTSGEGATARPSFPEHGTADHEALEKPVTGDAATKAQQAAVAHVGEGTAGDVTTDASGNGYEVTVTKADGSQVEVHLDSSFNAIEGHGGRHGGRCDGDGDGPGTPGDSTPSTSAPTPNAES